MIDFYLLLIKRINQKLEEFTEEIENASQFEGILTDLFDLRIDVILSNKIETREKHLYQIRIEALIKRGRRKEREKEEEDKRRRTEAQIKEKEEEIKKLTFLLASD